MGECVKLSFAGRRCRLRADSTLVLFGLSQPISTLDNRARFCPASERDKDFTRARVHAGALYFEAERE
jgi:hypothetical protein